MCMDSDSTECNHFSMMAGKIPRIRLLEFKITSCTEGTHNEYHLLKELPKSDYLSFSRRCREFPLFEANVRDQDIYVDLETRKLWVMTGEYFKVDEFERKAIELNLEKEVDIDKEPSSNLVNLKFLKETLVEWWCK